MLYSVVEKGVQGQFWICPFWLAKPGSVRQPHRAFTGVHVLGRVRPSLAPELPLIPSGWEGQYQLWRWSLGCLLLVFLVLELYSEVFQGRFLCL